MKTDEKMWNPIYIAIQLNYIKIHVSGRVNESAIEMCDTVH